MYGSSFRRRPLSVLSSLRYNHLCVQRMDFRVDVHIYEGEADIFAGCLTLYPASLCSILSYK